MQSGGDGRGGEWSERDAGLGGHSSDAAVVVGVGVVVGAVVQSSSRLDHLPACLHSPVQELRVLNCTARNSSVCRGCGGNAELYRKARAVSVHASDRGTGKAYAAVRFCI